MLTIIGHDSFNEVNAINKIIELVGDAKTLIIHPPVDSSTGITEVMFDKLNSDTETIGAICYDSPVMLSSLLSVLSRSPKHQNIVFIPESSVLTADNPNVTFNPYPTHLRHYITPMLSLAEHVIVVAHAYKDFSNNVYEIHGGLGHYVADILLFVKG